MEVGDKNISPLKNYLKCSSPNKIKVISEMKKFSSNFDKNQLVIDKNNLTVENSAILNSSNNNTNNNINNNNNKSNNIGYFNNTINKLYKPGDRRSSSNKNFVVKKSQNDFGIHSGSLVNINTQKTLKLRNSSSPHKRI